MLRKQDSRSTITLINKNLGLIILVQGENFRPHKVEALVDDMMSVFLEGIKHIDEKEFASVKQKILFEQIAFTNSLKDVADKYYDSVEEQLLNPNEKEYSELMKQVTLKSLYQFARRFLVKESRRITIELFAKKITDEEATYKLLPSFNLNQKSYQIWSLDDVVQRKSK